MDKTKVLESLPVEYREIGAKVFDKADIALKKYQPIETDFLDPGQQLFSERIVSRFYGLSYSLNGGNPSAERKKLIMYPEELAEVEIDDGLCFLEVIGNFRFQKVSHRDFLGAILNTGVKREKIGDIIITENGCQIVVTEEVKDYLLLNLTKIHNVSIDIKEISIEDLIEQEQPTKEINATVSSLRLDAVASAGYGLARNKIANYISADKVKVNWETRNSAGFSIQEGDMISARGLGRIKVKKVKGETKKGRIGIVISRYI